MTVKPIAIAACLLFVLFSSLPEVAAGSQASVPEAKITGIYTDMRMHSQTGDVVGVEIFLVFSRSGYQVIFQDAEGSPSVPVVVPATIDADRIEFSLPERSGYSGKFVGTIRASTITGEFANGQLSSVGKKTFVLKRRKSYWQG
jgi:hypothetical protein